MRFVLIVLVVLAPMGLGGCASVTRGWSEQMQINSQPEGAEVRTSLNQQCVTPCTLTVQRKDEFSVSFAKPGYQPQTVQVTTRVAGGGAAGFAGNILVGGIIGMGSTPRAARRSSIFPIRSSPCCSLRPHRAACRSRANGAAATRRRSRSGRLRRLSRRRRPTCRRLSPNRN